jgi:hypothetical protein
MTTAIGHITNYFVTGKNRDVFSAISIAADWVKIGPFLDEAGREIAAQISAFATQAWDAFIWPQLVSDSKDFVVSVQAYSDAPTTEKVQKVFTTAITLFGTTCEAIDNLHSRVKVIDILDHIPAVRTIAYMATMAVDIHDYIDECVNIYQNRGDRFMSILKLAKLVTNIALTVLAAWSFFSGVVVLPTVTLALSTLYLGLKIAIWIPPPAIP